MSSRKLTIRAGRSEAHYWADLWRYRELLYFLGWRDILVRYKQTALGVAWAVLKPVVTMVIFVAVFGRLAGMPSEGVPYPILVLAGLLPWQFFSSALTEASNSLILNTNLVSKVYFPRVIVPLSTVLVTLVDLTVTAALMAGLMIWYRVGVGWQVLALPIFLALLLAVSAGVGLWFAALNVKFRDFRHIVPFVVQFGVYASPVGFSSGVVRGSWKTLYAINPMVLIIDGFRWSILGGPFTGTLGEIVVGSAVSGLLLWGGMRYFRTTERSFADVI